MNRKITVRQRDLKDCGPCCLLSIIKYYGGNIPIETVRLDTKTNLEGTTAYNLIYAAKKYGFIAKGVKAKELDDNINLPAIAHIVTKNGFNHFVVIYKITNNYVYIMDPGRGMVKEKIAEFKSKWTNVILIFKPYRRIPLYNLKNSLKELFLRVLHEEKDLIIPIIITDVIITIISIVVSYYFQLAASSFENNSVQILILLIMVFLFINIAKIIFEYNRNNISIHLSKNIDLKIIPEFINHLFKLPSSITSTRTGGELLTRIQEMNSIKNLFTKILVSLTLDIFLIISTSIFLYRISNKLFIILCIISFIYLLVGLISNSIIYKRINENIDNETEFNSILIDEIDNIESIKNLDYTNIALDKIIDKYTVYEKSLYDYNKFQNSLVVIKNSINNLGLFIITSIGFIMIYQNELNILSLITFNYLLSYFIDPFDNIIDLIPEFNLIKLSFIKACEILNLDKEKEGQKEKFYNGDIIFKNLSYSYDDYSKVLNNFNLSIKENEHLSIKGNSGCGKSTLCQTLNRTYNDYHGQIKIKGINLKDYSIRTIKSNILYVSQREKLFNSNIEDNIRLNSKISKIELEKILEITEVNQLLNSKSNRLETIVYDSGYNFSGGERQRIILARSLAQKPKILILDESLSEVEEEREERIIKRIDEYMKNTTIIYISHRNKDYFNKTIRLGSTNE